MEQSSTSLVVVEVPVPVLVSVRNGYKEFTAILQDSTEYSVHVKQYLMIHSSKPFSSHLKRRNEILK